MSGSWLSNLWNDPERTAFPMRDCQKEKVIDLLSFNYATKDFWSLLPYTRNKKDCVRFDSTDYRLDNFYRCFATGQKANVGAVFGPKEAAHLAILAGCDVDDLPEQIRFWHKDEPYVGNSILDRLDPEDWVLKDYFRNLNFTVSFAMSKSYFNELRKSYGYSRFDFAKTDD